MQSTHKSPIPVATTIPPHIPIGVTIGRDTITFSLNDLPPNTEIYWGSIDLTTKKPHTRAWTVGRDDLCRSVQEPGKGISWHVPPRRYPIYIVPPPAPVPSLAPPTPAPLSVLSLNAHAKFSLPGNRYYTYGDPKHENFNYGVLRTAEGALFWYDRLYPESSPWSCHIKYENLTRMLETLYPNFLITPKAPEPAAPATAVGWPPPLNVPTLAPSNHKECIKAFHKLPKGATFTSSEKPGKIGTCTGKGGSDIGALVTKKGIIFTFLSYPPGFVHHSNKAASGAPELEGGWAPFSYENTPRIEGGLIELQTPDGSRATYRTGSPGSPHWLEPIDCKKHVRFSVDGTKWRYVTDPASTSQLATGQPAPATEATPQEIPMQKPIFFASVTRHTPATYNDDDTIKSPAKDEVLVELAQYEAYGTDEVKQMLVAKMASTPSLVKELTNAVGLSFNVSTAGIQFQSKAL